MTINRTQQSLDWASRIAKFELQAANLVYEGLDTPVSLSCYLLAKYEQYDDLVSKTVDPVDYNEIESFRLDYQAVSLLSKSKNLKTSYDLDSIAREKYFENEQLCTETNDLITAYTRGEVCPIDFEVQAVLDTVCSYVSSTLGKVTERTLELVERAMAFGPGATVGVKRVVTSGRKYDLSIIDSTPELLHFGLFCLPPLWKQTVTGFKPVAESELVFVPKNSKTNRAIEIQPTMNIYVQKGIGSVIRDKLKNVGLDLQSQKKNQDLARCGSYYNDYMTLDLSSASDTIAFSTVKFLFRDREDWFQLLNWARVQYVKDGSKVHPLEKFSAMGNGYTFELETLIFDCVIRACIHHQKRCFEDRVTYGDDMVFDKNAYPLIVKTLRFLGFKVNTQKTFGNTYFRESCGADFFHGVNVRPFFFRQEGKTFDDFTRICYHYGNQLLLAAHHLHGGRSRDRRFLAAWLLCYKSVPARLRHRVSPDYKSGGFLGSFDECVPSLVKAKHGWQGYFFKYLRFPTQTTRRYSRGALTSFLAGHRSDFSYGEEDLRGQKSPATTKTGYSLEWPDFGPWK